MCGLVGIAGDLAYRHELFMKRLLLLDFFRGTDSTGLAAIRTDGSTVLAKAAVNPITFFDMKAFDKALNGHQSTVFIGHNRAATLGKVNDANAHPYQFDTITGAHNGTLDKASWERLEQEAGVSTDTDSAAIFACINEIGIDDTIKLMEEGRTSSTGAWALVWYDRNKDTLNFLKNAHRPLWLGFNEDGDELFWASEWPMLNAAAQMTAKADWDGWWHDDDGYTFFPLQDDILYSIDVTELSEGLDDKAIKKFFKGGRKLEGREPAPLVTKTDTKARGTGGVPWKKADTSTTTSHTSFNNNNKKGSSLDDDDIADFKAKRNFQITTQERSVSSPLNGFITEERFNALVKYGCSFCAADIDINDTGYTIYDAEDCILCPDCSKNGDAGNVKLYLPVNN